jgi:hypothetical protein
MPAATCRTCRVARHRTPHLLDNGIISWLVKLQRMYWQEL